MTKQIPEVLRAEFLATLKRWRDEKLRTQELYRQGTVRLFENRRDVTADTIANIQTDIEDLERLIVSIETSPEA